MNILTSSWFVFMPSLKLEYSWIPADALGRETPVLRSSADTQPSGAVAEHTCGLPRAHGAGTWMSISNEWQKILLKKIEGKRYLQPIFMVFKAYFRL